MPSGYDRADAHWILGSDEHGRVYTSEKRALGISLDKKRASGKYILRPKSPSEYLDEQAWRDTRKTEFPKCAKDAKTLGNLLVDIDLAGDYGLR